jgi:hypothetical protein
MRSLHSAETFCKFIEFFFVRFPSLTKNAGRLATKFFFSDVAGGPEDVCGESNALLIKLFTIQLHQERLFTIQLHYQLLLLPRAMKLLWKKHIAHRILCQCREWI